MLILRQESCFDCLPMFLFSIKVSKEKPVIPRLDLFRVQQEGSEGIISFSMSTQKQTFLLLKWFAEWLQRLIDF